MSQTKQNLVTLLKAVGGTKQEALEAVEEVFKPKQLDRWVIMFEHKKLARVGISQYIDSSGDLCNFGHDFLSIHTDCDYESFYPTIREDGTPHITDDYEYCVNNFERVVRG